MIVKSTFKSFIYPLRMKQDKELAILETAIEMIRQGGYNCFSFRNIATAVGIKSSSVHYHFATKEDLIVAVTRHYTEKFLAALEEPKTLLSKGHDPISMYVSAFRRELALDQGMCLCGVLGAEANDLSELIVAETRAFFDRNVAWLEQAYLLKGVDEGSVYKNALQAISCLEGAMLICNASGDLSVFDLSTEHLLD